MIRLDLDEEERGILFEILESDRSDLRMEIADTDRQASREMLKGRKAVLVKVIEHLKAARLEA